MGQRCHDGAGGAARPEDEAPLARWIEPEVGTEGVDEALAVGAVSHQRAPPADDGVDDTQGLGHGRQLVDGGGGVGFVGHGDRESFQPKRSHRLHRGGASAGHHLEGDVGPVEVEGGEGGVVEDGRE